MFLASPVLQFLKHLLEDLLLLSLKESKLFGLVFSNIKYSLKQRVIYLWVYSKQMGVSVECDLFSPLIPKGLLADTCWMWVLSNVFETEPQNTQQQHTSFQMKQHGPFQGKKHCTFTGNMWYMRASVKQNIQEQPLHLLNYRPHYLFAC